MDELSTASGAADTATPYVKDVIEKYNLSETAAQVFSALFERGSNLKDICKKTGLDYTSAYNGVQSLIAKTLAERAGVTRFTYKLRPEFAPMLEGELNIYEILKKGEHSVYSISGALGMHEANVNLFVSDLADRGMVTLVFEHDKDRYENVYRIAGAAEERAEAEPAETPKAAETVPKITEPAKTIADVRKVEESAAYRPRPARAERAKRARNKRILADDTKMRKLQEALADLNEEEQVAYKLIKVRAESPSTVAEKLGISPIEARLYLHTMKEMGLAVIDSSGNDSMSDTYRAKPLEEIVSGSIHVLPERRLRSRLPERKAEPPVQQQTQRGRSKTDMPPDPDYEEESIFDDPGSKLNDAFAELAAVGMTSMSLNIKTERMIGLTKYAVSKIDQNDRENSKWQALNIARLASDCAEELLFVYNNVYDSGEKLRNAVDFYATLLDELFGMMELELDLDAYKPSKPML